jgi:UDP-glucose 4-epimerase
MFMVGKPFKTGFLVYIDRARAGRPLEVWGNPDVGRDIIYVKDVVAAFMSAMDRPHVTGLFNITSGVYLTLREQAQVIARTFWAGLGEPEIVYRPESPNGMDAFLYDNSKARRELGWSPRFGFREMLLDYEQEAASQRHRHLMEKRKSLFNQP